MEIIDELEPVRRGFYGGTVGYFGHGGDMDHAIAIRTMVFHGDTYSFQAGRRHRRRQRAGQRVPRSVREERRAARARSSSRGRASDERPRPPRLLLIDNYDSFTYNLVQAFLVLGAEVLVHRNDAITVEQAQRARADAPVHLARARARRTTPACRWT